MQSFEEPSLRSWSKESNTTKTGGQKSHFLRSRSLPRPALLSCPLVPFERRVALRDAMRALSCAPHAIAATLEFTAADLAQERRGADDAMGAAGAPGLAFTGGGVHDYDGS